MGSGGQARVLLLDRGGQALLDGVMGRRPYRVDGGREREEYVLTPAGEELRVVLGALNAWGDRHRPSPDGPASVFVEAETGGPVTLSFTTADGRHLEPAAVSAVRLAPAARS